MDYILGSILLLPFNFTPREWLPCEGQTLEINQNQALYSLIGDTFGGDGIRYFRLPDLKNASPTQGLRYFICMQGIYPQREG